MMAVLDEFASKDQIETRLTDILQDDIATGTYTQHEKWKRIMRIENKKMFYKNLYEESSTNIAQQKSKMLRYLLYGYSHYSSSSIP